MYHISMQQECNADARLQPYKCGHMLGTKAERVRDYQKMWRRVHLKLNHKSRLHWPVGLPLYLPLRRLLRVKPGGRGLQIVLSPRAATRHTQVLQMGGGGAPRAGLLGWVSTGAG